MKLFLILSILTTVGEVKSSTVVNSPQERILASSFQEAELIPIGFENHSQNSCLNGRDVVSYSKQGTKSYGHIAEVNETWYKILDKETIQEIYYYDHGGTAKENKTFTFEKYTPHAKMEIMVKAGWLHPNRLFTSLSLRTQFRNLIAG